MITEIRGSVPKLPFPLARTLVKRAWKDIRRNNLWGFQLYDGPQWISPVIVSNGLATTIQGSATVTLDAAATAALNASALAATYSPITKRQFRIGAGTIYNIWGWDSLGTITLDRAYGEASATLSAYNILQVYYPAPYEDHLTFVTIRDMQNFMNLRTNMTREQIDGIDPQRTWYCLPTAAVYYQQDQNPSSNTYRFPLYELWGLPTAARNYQLYGIRRGAELSSNTDTLPPAVGEDCVIAQAKIYAYEWAEANKGTIARNQGPDFKFLVGGAKADFKRLLQEYRRQDRETVNNWYSVRRLSPYYNNSTNGPYYNAVSATASPGWG